MASSDRIGMDPAVVEAQASRITSYTVALDGLADEAARSGYASRAPGLFGLLPGNLIMSAGSILLAESAAADIRQAVASAQELVGRLSAEAETQRYVSSATDGSYLLGFMSPADAQALYQRVLDDPSALDDMTPQQIAGFWAHLSPEQSEELWRTYPQAFGNRSGVPFDVRINANRLNAINDLDAGEFTSVEHEEYLEAMARGEIQLVTFDPDNHRFVEAIGLADWDPVSETFVQRETPPREVITYVPGTFTTDQSMYEGGNRSIPEWFAANHPEAVVFLYKDGVFPGGLKGDSDLITGITEANSAELGQLRGEQLYRFQQDLNLNPVFFGAEQTAVGHSWGLANIANSEVSGASYDNVISLAGAWVPEAWAANSGTEYSHHSYVDLLSVAQDLPGGPVGGGRNPDVTPGFNVHLYQGPDDHLLGFGGENGILDDAGVLLENHNLVATTKEDNEDVLRNIELEIFQ
jgi:hypothetical protein